jgi:hypothetical protein
MHCAFARGDSLYGGRWRPVTTDPDVQALLLRKFERLARHRLEVNEEQLSQYTVELQEIAFPFPHSDIAAYAGRLWIASPEGLQVADWDATEERLGLVARRAWDCPLLSLSPNYALNLGMVCRRTRRRLRGSQLAG